MIGADKALLIRDASLVICCSDLRPVAGKDKGRREASLKDESQSQGSTQKRNSGPVRPRPGGLGG